MIIVDTTVLVDAVGGEHPLRDPCRCLVSLVRDRVVRATPTVEAVKEFARLQARRRSRGDAAAVDAACARGLAPLPCPGDDDLLAGLDLFGRSRELGAFDAVLAASALRRGWALVSADRGFRGAGGLVPLDSTRPGFVDQVRAAA